MHGEKILFISIKQSKRALKLKKNQMQLTGPIIVACQWNTEKKKKN